MSDDITIDVGMNNSQYMAGADQVYGANSKLQASMMGLASNSIGVQKAIGLVGGHKSLVGFGALATVAGNAQSQLSGLHATSAVTDISAKKLSISMRQLARDMPVGNTGARELVSQFTQMGLSSAGSEGKIAALSKSVGQLAGATGEGPGGLATGMVQFARATGNIGLDPKRFQAMGDALTTVSKTSGASATNILAFSHNIAPLAQAAGIGTTGIMGISAAFSSMGEDGVGASTAVSKMLSDMSRSVREGSPEMKIYGEIVGTTADKFKEMFIADPLGQTKKVLSSIASSGNQGIRQLEALNLDGVRTQRPIQRLMQEGTLDKSIASAAEGYGSGATEKASAEAYAGLNDQFTELTATSQQLAEALGAPILAPLTAFAKALKVPLGGAVNVLNSKAAQTALTVAGGAALAMMLGKGVIGPLMMAGMGRQGLTSLPAKGFWSGVSQGRGDEAGSTRASRWGAPVQKLADDGTLADRPMGKTATKFRGAGLKLGALLNPEQSRAAGPGAMLRTSTFDTADEMYTPRPASPDAHPSSGPLKYNPAGGNVGYRLQEAEAAAANAAEQTRLQQARGPGYAKYEKMSKPRRVLHGARVIGMSVASTLIGDTGRMADNAIKPVTERDASFALPESSRKAFEDAKAAAKEAGGGRRGAVTGLRTGYQRLMALSMDSEGPSLREKFAGAKTTGSAAAEAAGGGLRGLGAGTAAAARSMTHVTASAGGLSEMLKQVAKAGSGMKNLAVGFANDAGSRTQLAASMRGGVASTLGFAGRGIGKGAGALVGAMGGPVGLGLMAAGAGVSGLMANDASNRERAHNYAQEDQNATLNRYREAAGRAGVAYQANDGGRSEVAATAKNAATIESAKKVTEADVTNASSTMGKLVTQYRGSDKEIMAQITGAMPAAGMEPSDLKGIELDLLRGGKSQSETQKIIDSLPKSAFASPVGQEANSIAGSNVAGVRGMVNSSKNVASGGGAAAVGEFMAGFAQMVGIDKHVNTASTEGLTAEKTITESVKSRWTAQGKQYKGEYANKKRNEAEDAAIQQALDNNDVEQSRRLQEQFQINDYGNEYHGKKKAQLRPDQIKAAGGYNAALAADDAEFGPGVIDKAYKKTMADKDADKAINIPSYYSSILGDAANGPISKSTAFAADLFDVNKNKSEAKTGVNALVGHEGDLKAQSLAGDAFVAAGKQAGLSLNEIALAATKVGNSFDATSAAAIAASDALIKVGNATRVKEMTQTGGQSMQERAQGFVGQIEQFNAAPSMVAGDKAANQTNVEGLQSLHEEALNTMKARLEAQRQFQTGKTRMQADSVRQERNTITDNQTQITRSTDAYNLQTARAKEDFQLQTDRSDHDFQLGRTNALRDYGVNVKNMEADVYRSRKLANRDFNISLSRQIQDSAKTMLDPYNRIQTKATWDVQNLMVNMKQQNEAMEQQKKQLDELRKMGLSTQVIDQLQLGKTENAQQVNNLALDLKNNPNAVGDLNKVGAQRGKDAGALYTDSSNTDLKRQREDLAKGQKDQLDQLAITIKRGKKALDVSLSDQLIAYNLNVSRTAFDFNKGLSRSSKDFKTQIGYMVHDQKLGLSRMHTELGIQIARMQEDLVLADEKVVGSLGDIQAAFQKAVLGQSVNFNGLLAKDSAAIVATLNTNVKDVQKALGPLGVVLVGTAGSGSGQGQKDNPRSGGSSTPVLDTMRAAGGPIPGFSPHSRADNINIKATAGEFMQPVDAVAYYGADNMEKLRTKKIPKGAFDEYGDVQGLAAGGMVWPSMRDWARNKFPNTTMTSGYRAGGKTYHGKGSAIDLAPPSAGIFNAIKAAFGSSIKELIYSPMKNQQIKDGHSVADSFYAAVRANHFNHVHWAMTPGQDMATGMPIAGGSGDASGASGGLSDVQVKRLLGFDQKRGGLYGKMRDKIEAAVVAKFAAAGDNSGDIGAHGAGPAANQKIAAGLLKKYGFDQGQMVSLVKLWNGESGWNEKADNPSSDAYGIPQSLPGSKMASAGKDWKTNPATQINWGLSYIKSRYGTPDKALQQWNARSPHWYDQGGVMSPGRGTHVNNTGKPEAVLTNEQWSGVAKLADRAGELISREESKKMGASNGIHMTVHHNEVITYDSRNDFGDAKITVMSNDPDDMARKLEKKVVKGRVTQTRGVRRN